MSQHVDFQNYSLQTIFSAVTVGASPSVSSVYGPTQLIEHQNQLVFYFNVATAAITMYMEFSHDGTNFFKETWASVTAGAETDYPLVRTLAVGTYRIAIPIKDRYFRMTIAGNTAVVTCQGIIGTA